MFFFGAVHVNLQGSSSLIHCSNPRERFPALPPFSHTHTHFARGAEFVPREIPNPSAKIPCLSLLKGEKQDRAEIHFAIGVL